MFLIDGCSTVVTTTCTSIDFSLAARDCMRFVVADTDVGAGVNARFIRTITNVSVSGSTTGIEGDFQSDEGLISNNRAVTNLTEFNVGDTLDTTTVFPGGGQRATCGPGIFTDTDDWFQQRCVYLH